MKNLFFLLLLLPILGFGQHGDFPYFGILSDDDLKMITYDKDSTAAAVYLMNYGKTRYDEVKQKPCFYYDHHYQIKIFKKSAFDEADISFFYYKKSPIENIHAVIHYMENGERKTKEVTDFRTVDVSKYLKAYQFSFPNVKEGAVLEYCYTTKGNVISLPDDFYFQKKYPVKHGEYHFVFPSYFDYQMVQPKLQFDEFDHRIIKVKKRASNTEALTEYWWKAFDIDGLATEPYVHNVLDYRHRIRLQRTSFFDNGSKDGYKFEWISLGYDYQALLRRVLNNYNPVDVRKIVKPLKEKITSKTSDLEKVKILYDYVQNLIEWNEMHTRFLVQPINDIYKNKVGTSADINLFLYRLLKHYGMEVYPVLVSSRDNGRVFKDYPFIEQFNHVVLQIQIQGKPIIIDATDKTYAYDLQPKDAFGEEGFLIKGEESNFIALNMKKAEVVQYIEATIANSGNILGDIKSTYKNYAAYETRQRHEELGEEKYKSTYFEQSNDFKIKTLSFENLDNKNENLIEQTTFEIKDAVQIAGNIMYCNVMLNINGIEHPFTKSARQLPIEMPFPTLQRSVIKINIPEGYQIETLPEEVNITLPKDGGEYTFNIAQKENVIVITSSIYVKRLHFEVAEYEAVKTFYDKIIEIQNSQIVLKQH